MGIDYIIHYDCEPKRALTLEGLMGRLKGRERAQAVIRLYRDQGDMRRPVDMGFEMVRHGGDGTEQREVIVVQDLLNAAEELTPWEHFCEGCPANRAHAPFGCVGGINYSVSEQGERWLLDQLPDHEHPLIFMLLQSALREHNFRGESAQSLRSQEGVFLEAVTAPERDLEAVRINGNQVFELLFLSGHIAPAYGMLLLQFYGAVSQDLDADAMMRLGDPPSTDWLDEHLPFQLRHTASDDATIYALKEFFWAIYLAYGLRVPLLLDV